MNLFPETPKKKTPFSRIVLGSIIIIATTIFNKGFASGVKDNNSDDPQFYATKKECKEDSAQQ